MANIRHAERKVSTDGAVRYSGLVSSNLLQELDLARRRKVWRAFFCWNFCRYGAECTGSIKIHLARGEETLKKPASLKIAGFFHCSEWHCRSRRPMQWGMKVSSQAVHPAVIGDGAHAVLRQCRFRCRSRSRARNMPAVRKRPGRHNKDLRDNSLDHSKPGRKGSKDMLHTDRPEGSVRKPRSRPAPPLRVAKSSGVSRRL